MPRSNTNIKSDVTGMLQQEENDMSSLAGFYTA
jgi:hypothetical protein